MLLLLEPLPDGFSCRDGLLTAAQEEEALLVELKNLSFAKFEMEVWWRVAA